MELQGKTVVLTGATGGIGRALAQELQRCGARLILTGRNPDMLRALREQLGEQHVIVCTDLTTTEGRQELLRVCSTLEGGVPVLINNAGVSEFAGLEKQTGIEQLLTINLTVPILICQMLLPLLRQQPAACILNIGSTFGSIGYPGFSTYCASKFGLRGFTQAMRRELSGGPVAVVYVAPRATKTAINDERVNRLNAELGNATDDVGEVAERIVDALIRQNKAEVYIGWPEKLFVKVNALLPSVVDKSLSKQLSVIENCSRA